MKTNGARFLESLGIPFELREYEVDPEDLSAITVAKKIGMPAEQVFKTLLVTTGGPSDLSSSPSSPATPNSTSRSSPAPPACAKPRWPRSKTSSPSPATSAAASPSSAQRKPYPVFIDETAILFDKISVSAGARGTQLILAPATTSAPPRPLKSKSKPPTSQNPNSLAGGTSPMTRALWTHLVKDLRIEWRSLDAIISMLFFSGLVVVLFSIAFDPRGAFSQQIAGGVLCVATMFASVSALNQAWAREIRHQVMDAQRMVPAPGAELFLAKVIANFLFVTIVQIVLAPFFFIFYNLHIAGQAWLLALVLPLGTWALVGNGVFFAALSIRSRNRELLLSLILFPIFIPALLAMVQATTAILTGESDPTLWIKMLLGYDIIFTTASLLLFDVVFHAE